MPAELAAPYAIALAGGELSVLAELTAPAPLVTFPDPGLDAAACSEALRGLIARGVLRTTPDGRVLPSGDEAAILGIVLTADDALVLRRHDDDGRCSLALYDADGLIVAHTDDRSLHRFAPVDAAWSKDALEAFTGIAVNASAPPVGPWQVRVAVDAWSAAQRAGDSDEAAQHLPGLEILAGLLFDARRVLSIDRLRRVDDRVDGELITIYEPSDGSELWVVCGGAGAAELVVHRATPAQVGRLLSELLP